MRLFCLVCCLLLWPLPHAQAAETAEPEAEPEPAASAADDAPPAGATPLEPVTVTATRTQRPVFELAESVSLISREQIQNHGASDLGEALTLAPGVELSGGPRPGAESVNIRGLSGTRVLLSVDGARQNFDGAHRSRLNADPDLYKHIDILRGPASALWGSDALGGVVSLTTKDAADFLNPGETLGARIKLGSESADRLQRGGGTLFSRIGGLDLLADYNQQDSQDIEQADGSRLPHSANATRAGLYKLGYDFGGAGELRASLQTYRQATQSPSNPSQPVTRTNPLLDRLNDQQYQTLQYSYQPGSGGRVAGLNIVAYRSALDVLENRVVSPREDTLSFVTTGASAQTTLALPGWASQLSLGGETYRDTGGATRNGEPRPQFPDSVRRVSGVFVQNELAGERWSLTPGLRYDRYRAHSNTQAAEDIRADALSLKLGSRYALNHWLSLSALYGEAFRAPSLLESYAQGQHFLANEFRPNPALRPERARNLELGAQLRFDELFSGDDRLQLRLNVYENRIRDFIETTVVVETQGPFPPATQCAVPMPPVGCVNRAEDGTLDPSVPVLIFVGGFTTSENLTQARIRGGELESRYQLGALDLGLNFSQIRGTNRDSGGPLLNVPADQLRASGGWRLANWQLGLRLTHALAQERVPRLEDGSAVIPTTPAYTTADVFATWRPLLRLNGLQLNLGVDNLNNAQYRRHLANFAESGRSLRAGLIYQF
jgi:hemoglobin/transferrin/lactoferrin receptor protein